MELVAAGDGRFWVSRRWLRGRPVGLHQTDTVDIVTIISGELIAITETSETVLRPGDSLVQNGTVHTWANRGDVPCMKVAVQIGAQR
jgi:uncharacterized cupin superfamily protein